MMAQEVFPLVILYLGLIAAVITDIWYQKIPNWLILSIIFSGLCYHMVYNGLEGLAFGLKGIGAGIACLIIPYYLGGMGAGDAKLLGAVGCILGPKGVFFAFLMTALVGGIYACGVLIFYGGFRGIILRVWIIVQSLWYGRGNVVSDPKGETTRPRLRYGVAIAAGTFLSVLFHDRLMTLL